VFVFLVVNLSVVLISSAVAQVVFNPSLVAVVHSVTHDCVILLTSHSCLISIGRSGHEDQQQGHTPEGILVQCEETFTKLGFIKGIELNGNGKILTSTTGRISISLEKAVTFESHILSVSKDIPGLMDKVGEIFTQIAQRLLENSMESSGLGPLFVHGSGISSYHPSMVWRNQSIHAIKKLASNSNDEKKLVQTLEAVNTLLNTGMGVTRSPGTDFLIGWCASLWAFNMPFTKRFCEGLEKIIAGAGVISISETFLLYAAKGHFNEWIHTTIGILVNPTPDLVRVFVERTISSGNIECALGILMCIQAFHNTVSWVENIPLESYTSPPTRRRPRSFGEYLKQGKLGEMLGLS